MADNILSGLATGLQTGQALNLQRQQAQQAQDDRKFNRLVSTFGLIPKDDTESQQVILNALSDISDGKIPRVNLAQGKTLMSVLKPSLDEFNKGTIDKNEILERVNLLGLERPSEAAGLEKFAAGFEERAITGELQQAEAIAELQRTQPELAEAGGAEQARRQLLISATGKPVIPETKINDPAIIRSFEIAQSQELTSKGIKRGTQEYTDELTKFREQTVGGLKLVGRDPITGELLTMGKFTPGLTRTDPQGQIVSITKARTPATDLKDLSVVDSLIEQIDVIREIALANPDKIGPLEGRWNTMRIKFAEDKDGTLLKRNITSLIRLAYALSGKQISVQELKMLSEFILPSINLPDANFQTALGFAGEMLKRDRRTRETRLRDNDYFLGGERTQTPQGINIDTWLPQAKRANPDASDQELINFFNKKYGGQ